MFIVLWKVINNKAYELIAFSRKYNRALLAGFAPTFFYKFVTTLLF